MYVYVVALFLAMCSWVDVELSEETQYQYPEQPPSCEQFEQQEQFEEGKYNMNNTCNTRFIKGHKPSNHICARIKSHVYTIE